MGKNMNTNPKNCIYSSNCKCKQGKVELRRTIDFIYT